MNADCKKVEENVIDFIERKLPEPQQKIIRKHIEGCPQCYGLVKRFADIWQEFPEQKRSIPSDKFWPELFAKIQAYENPQPLWDKVITGLRSSLRPAAVSLILLLGVFFGYHLGNMPGHSNLSEVTPVEQYITEFQDFPIGSVGDFFTTYEIQIQEERP